MYRRVEKSMLAASGASVCQSVYRGR